MTLFRNKYRVESARLNHWNYNSIGAYFITICTKNRTHFFGNIVPKSSELSNSSVSSISSVETPCMASLNETTPNLSTETPNMASLQSIRPNFSIETPDMASLQSISILNPSVILKFETKNSSNLPTSNSHTMSLFQNKYRIESARLNNWNYNSMGAYFITICTKNRTHFFGQIVPVASHSSVSSVSSLETPCMASLQSISILNPSVILKFETKNSSNLPTSNSHTMSLFQNKYRIESARLNNWNYNSMGAYFITICTKNRTHFFGNIVPKSSELSNSSVSSVETPCMASLNEITPDLSKETPNMAYLLSQSITPNLSIETLGMASLQSISILNPSVILKFETKNSSNLPTSKPHIMSLFQNKYRIESARLNNWNYNSMGAYFITICTKKHTHFFGQIVPISYISSVETPKMASLNETTPNLSIETPGMASLQSFSPNLSIETPNMASLQSTVQNQMVLSKIGQILHTEWLKTPTIRPDMNLFLDEFIVMPNHFHAIIIIGKNKYNKHPLSNSSVSSVETPCMASQNSLMQKPGPQRNNLSSIIRGFKSTVTVQARLIDPDFAWQTRFHDHLIQNNKEYARIQKYIINNPLSWKKDKFNN